MPLNTCKTACFYSFVNFRKPFAKKQKPILADSAGRDAFSIWIFLYP